MQSNTTRVDIFSFNFETMAWSVLSIAAEFVIEDDILGEGAFRKAYKATSTTKGFADTDWVIKRYIECAIKVIEDTQQTVEDHTSHFSYEDSSHAC